MPLTLNGHWMKCWKCLLRIFLPRAVAYPYFTMRPSCPLCLLRSFAARQCNNCLCGLRLTTMARYNMPIRLLSGVHVQVDGRIGAGGEGPGLGGVERHVQAALEVHHLVAPQNLDCSSGWGRGGSGG